MRPARAHPRSMEPAAATPMFVGLPSCAAVVYVARRVSAAPSKPKGSWLGRMGRLEKFRRLPRWLSGLNANGGGCCGRPARSASTTSAVRAASPTSPTRQHRSRPGLRHGHEQRCHRPRRWLNTSIRGDGVSARTRPLSASPRPVSVIQHPWHGRFAGLLPRYLAPFGRASTQRPPVPDSQCALARSTRCGALATTTEGPVVTSGAMRRHRRVVPSSMTPPPMAVICHPDTVAILCSTSDEDKPFVTFSVQLQKKNVTWWHVRYACRHQPGSALGELQSRVIPAHRGSDPEGGQWGLSNGGRGFRQPSPTLGELQTATGPSLATHDATGTRVDEVEYDPAYHELDAYRDSWRIAAPWADVTASGAYVVRAAKTSVWDCRAGPYHLA